MHHYNLKTLAYEILKEKNNMVPETLTEIFPLKESNYILRNSTAQQGRGIKIVMHGSETMFIIGQKIWVVLPKELKQIVSNIIQKINSSMGPKGLPMLFK